MQCYTLVLTIGSSSVRSGLKMKIPVTKRVTVRYRKKNPRSSHDIAPLIWYGKMDESPMNIILKQTTFLSNKYVTFVLRREPFAKTLRFSAKVSCHTAKSFAKITCNIARYWLFFAKLKPLFRESFQL